MLILGGDALRGDGDHVGGEIVLVTQLHAAVDGWMHDEPAGKGFVGVAIDLIVFAQPGGDRLPVLLNAHHSGPTAPRLDALKRAGVALLGEKG